MTKNQRRVLWPALLTALLVVTTLTFAASTKLRNTIATGTSSQDQPVVLSANRAAYVRRSLLSPKLAWNLKALGDRLERPGRERLSMAATLTRPQDSQPEHVVAVFEFPDYV